MVADLASAAESSLLAALVLLVDRIPLPPAPGPSPRRGRGRPTVYPDRLFLKALVIMIVRRRPRVGTFLAVLEPPTADMARLRALLTDARGRFPSRRTWERRLARVPHTLPAQGCCLGNHLVARLDPWAACGRAAAIDSTVLRARGGVWHKKDREAGVVPHTSIDTEAPWPKSGWHGWGYGWKLHLVVTAAAVWIPLAAELTPANVADNEAAPSLREGVPEEVRYILGDRHYNAPDVRAAGEGAGRTLVASRYGAYPHRDDGVEVRRVFHKLRSTAIEHFNEHFKAIFGGHDQVPARGRQPTRRFALGAVLVYQLTLLHRFEHGQHLRVGLKSCLLAA
jgi:Transposase DDE domain